MTHKHTAYSLQLTENGSPDTPPADHLGIYPKIDGLWYQKDENGIERRLAHVGIRNMFYETGDTDPQQYAQKIVLNSGAYSSYTATAARVNFLTNSRKRRFMAVTQAGNSVVPINYPTPSWVSPGSASIISRQADSCYALATTSAVIGSLAGLYTGSAYGVNSNADPTMECRVLLNLTTSLRIWVGLMAQTPPNSNSVTNQTVAFLFNGKGWIPVTHNGTTQTTGTAIGTVAGGTPYLLRARVVGTSAYFSVNNGTEQVISTNVPTTGRMGMVCAVIATAAASRTIYLSRIQVEANT